jgi:hypothetical protein
VAALKGVLVIAETSPVGLLDVVKGLFMRLCGDISIVGPLGYVMPCRRFQY